MTTTKRCAFVTLGCKINQYETEAVRELLLARGWREVPPAEAADLYVVNACSVTGTSGAKSRRAVLRLARSNPAARIAVMGCSTPEERALLGKIPQVAIVVGNEEKAVLPDLIEAGEERRPAPEAGRLRVPRPGLAGRDPLDLSVDRFESRTRAFVKVQDGCSAFCSFCIVPFLRGLSRSRPRAAILEEVRRLGGNGYREVVVTGIHLQEYGADLDPPEPLSGLLAAIAAAARPAGVRRIRLSSINPRAFAPDLLDALRDPLFCPHWHVPLQSGDDGVLAAMRRDYGRAEFLETAARLAESFARPSITTDIIVGHPGEDGAAFARTVDACERVGFSKIHIFPFSPREGTRSARLPGAVPPGEIARRVEALEAVERDLALRYKRAFAGEEVEVLVEGAAGRRGAGARAGSVEGFTERYLRARFPAADPAALRNRLARVRVETVRPDILEGALVGGES